MLIYRAQWLTHVGRQDLEDLSSRRDSVSTSRKLDIVVQARHPSYTGGENKRNEVQARPNIKVRPYLKTKAKKARNVAQVVQP
jgi:hypothetical protein